MKVKDLIAELVSLDNDEAEVMFQYPSGDYWRTELAGEIREIEMTTVEWSEYHREYALPRDPDKNPEEMERPKRVLLLK